MYSLFIWAKCMHVMVSFREGHSLFETHTEIYWWVINRGILNRGKAVCHSHTKVELKQKNVNVDNHVEWVLYIFLFYLCHTFCSNTFILFIFQLSCLVFYSLFFKVLQVSYHCGQRGHVLGVISEKLELHTITHKLHRVGLIHLSLVFLDFPLTILRQKKYDVVFHHLL